MVAALLAGCGGTQNATQPPAGAVDDGGAMSPNDPPSSDDLAAAGPRDGGVPHDLEQAPPPDLAKPAPPTKKVLNFVWQGEEQYYMCGPSAARMALSTRLADLPTQQQLGSYMGTTTNGTDYIGLVRGALNHYLNITSYGETDLTNDPPSQAQQDALKRDVVASIDAGYGLVANVVSGWRPSFYPQSGTIYHYIALVGYDASGAKVLVADPAATGCGDGACGSPSSGFYNTPKSYWINTSDLGVWITPKGYTWHP
ncbi:MAG: lysis protein [bacterium]|nr:lysis protein [bacterium]